MWLLIALGLAVAVLRDIGILLLVFGPLDALFQGKRPGVALVFIMMGLLFIAAGIILEANE